jgi:hypothetical protein
VKLLNLMDINDFEISASQCPTHYCRTINGDVLNVVVQKNVRLSEVFCFATWVTVSGTFGPRQHSSPSDQARQISHHMQAAAVGEESVSWLLNWLVGWLVR